MEFEASIEEMIAAAADEPAENTGPIAVVTVLELVALKNVTLAASAQVCAIASEEADAMPATAVMPRMICPMIRLEEGLRAEALKSI